MAHTAKIGIIGAGISGLATAYYLIQESLHQNLEIEVTILERSDRLGGVIWSEKTEGFLLEGGPQNFVAFKPQILELIKELGLGDEVMGSNDKLRQTFVLQDSRLQPLPQGMEFLFPVRVRPFWSSSLISTRAASELTGSTISAAAAAGVDRTSESKAASNEALLTR